ncbi:DUF4307 domain-containing protein [Microbacterium sp. SORGH_AS_0888]|uniref:DUF4307 domain-containing protein n=1 Tax=Microbacterium sp. SORGH_AS_0888 TaxID=3041791 RepID=UPI0027850B16|nr:DUF4307 domain-containing protein [Microbacterium sp. SORGH_AS_0888]MDQ1128117.1 hypothetical protein [Microbacterium sp. SORGH_AS_0888]
MTTTQQMLDERYGRTPRSRRFWVWFTTVAVAVAIAVAGWFAWSSTVAATDATTTGFELIDAHTVTVTFQVTAPAGSPIACVLEAQDTDHGVVGWKVVEYPASDAHSQAFTETVPVVAEATTGLVNSCWVP